MDVFWCLIPIAKSYNIQFRKHKKFQRKFQTEISCVITKYTENS